MNKIIAGLTLMVGLGFSGFAVTHSTEGPGMSVISSAANAQYDDRYCRRLRRACEYKDERGERGEGNCRRYRRECRR
jgi:hypothetical protein